MKILIFSTADFSIGSGSEIRGRLICEGLQREGAKVCAVCRNIPDYFEKLRFYISYNKTAALKKICLLPYHKAGSSKYESLKMPYRISDVLPPSNEKMKELKKYFEESGVNVKIGG